MILYYVAAESDTDWDLDSTDHYKTKKEEPTSNQFFPLAPKLILFL